MTPTPAPSGSNGRAAFRLAPSCGPYGARRRRGRLFAASPTKRRPRAVLLPAGRGFRTFAADYVADVARAGVDMVLYDDESGSPSTDAGCRTSSNWSACSAAGSAATSRWRRRGKRPIDSIDDADDIDDPRTEGRRRRAHTLSRTPEGARKAEGRACALRRRVVDVVGSSKGDAEVRPSPPRASFPPVMTRPEAASPIPPPPAMTLPETDPVFRICAPAGRLV